MIFPSGRHQMKNNMRRMINYIKLDCLPKGQLLILELWCSPPSIHVLIFKNKTKTSTKEVQIMSVYFQTTHSHFPPSCVFPPSLPPSLPPLFRRMWSCQTLSLQSSKICWRGCCRETYPRGSAVRAEGTTHTQHTHTHTHTFKSSH